MRCKMPPSLIHSPVDIKLFFFLFLSFYPLLSALIPQPPPSSGLMEHLWKAAAGSSVHWSDTEKEQGRNAGVGLQFVQGGPGADSAALGWREVDGQLQRGDGGGWCPGRGSTCNEKNMDSCLQDKLISGVWEEQRGLWREMC